MCGICGLLSGAALAAEALQTTVRGMTATLAHRGPDDFGTFVDAAAGIGLGHRRLAVLDLSPLGRQPMRSASGRYVVSFNGEIYNFARLRVELASLGHAFRGNSDTEVLLAAVEEWGLEAAVRRFNGMFAFALWDRRTRRLALVRDRLGVKPLYYGTAACGAGGRDFVFGSELKALAAHPGFEAELDREALVLYFRHGWIPAPQSIYRTARKLPAGTILSVAAGGTPKLERYWSAAEAAARGAEALFPGGEDEALERLEELLKDAVGLRLLADVPLGAFLSGGIDSSLVTAFMRERGAQPVRTFSIGFAEAECNEAPAAAAAARRLGCRHTEYVLRERDVADIVPFVPRIWDEPFADSSQIPTYAVSRLARRDVTVALTGDGGDELFLGYDRYFYAVKWWRRLRRIPGFLRSGAAGLARLRPERLAGLFGNFGRRTLWRLDAVGLREFPAFYKRLLSQHPRPAALVLGAGPEPPTALDDVPAGPDLYRAMGLWDELLYLPDDILTKVDRASMAVGLEARTPLLDHRVVEFAASLPTAFLIRGGRGKHLLRRLLSRRLPAELVERPKRGFGIPLASWLPGRLRPWAGDVLAAGRRQCADILDFRIVDRMWARLLAGGREQTYPLWNVLMFLAWQAEARPRGRGRREA